MGGRSGEVVAQRRSAAVPGMILRSLRPYVLLPFLGLLAFLLAYPIFMVLYASFKGGPPGEVAPFTLDGYVRAWGSWSTYKALILTFALGIPRVVLGVGIALVITWIITRTNTPLRWLFEQLMWFHVFLPTLPMVLSWILIAGGRSGLLNKFLMNTFNLANPPLNIQSYWGVIFYSVIGGGTMFFLYASPAFRNMDASLEESSRVSGASALTTLFRITTPLLMPAILGVTFLMFLFTLSSYETELFFLYHKGAYVLSTWIWWQAQKMPPDYPTAMALASIFVVFVVAIIVLQFKILGNRQYVTITGRGFGIRTTDLGRWKWVTFGFLTLLNLVGLIAPLTVLIIGTFLNSHAVLSSGFTLDHWKRALGDPAVIKSIRNTLELGVMVAISSTVLFGLMSYMYLKTKLRFRQWIEILSWVPRSAPAVVLSLGVVWAVLGGGIPGARAIYGTLALMAIVILLDRTPQGMRLMNAGLVQLSAELEEASRVSGGSWFLTIRKVVMPVIMPTLLNQGLLSFVMATRALVVLLFMYMPASVVLSIDIFTHMMTNEPQVAAILGVILTALTTGVAILARIVAFRQRKVMEVVPVG